MHLDFAEMFAFLSASAGLVSQERTGRHRERDSTRRASDGHRELPAFPLPWRDLGTRCSGSRRVPNTVEA